MLLLKDFIFISICLQRAASKHHILAAVFCYMKQKPAKKGLSSGEKIMIVLIIHMTGSMTTNDYFVYTQQTLLFNHSLQV